MSLKQSFLLSDVEFLSARFRDARFAICLRSSFLAVCVDNHLNIVPFRNSGTLPFSPKPIDTCSPICSILLLSVPFVESSSNPDETDIITLGLLDGSVLFLDISGTILLELDFDSGAVRDLSVRLAAGQLEVILLTDSCIFLVNLNDLQDVLKKCMSESNTFKRIFYSTEATNHTAVIRLRKFIPPHGERFTQLTFYEFQVQSVFNHMVKNSIETPYEQSKDSWHNMHAETLWTLTGVKPFVSFNLSENVAGASIRSLLYSEAKRVLLGARAAKENVIHVDFSDEQKPPIGCCHSVMSDSLSLLHGLADERRHVICNKSVTSADRCWLAIADSLGRILLVDILRQRVVRMWKGYREAELAFVDATELPSHDSDPTRSVAPVRSMRCLFIHAPHRRILEVWRLTHGPRLATWDVEEPVRLVQSEVLQSRTKHRENFPYLIDSKGVIYTLSVNPKLCLADTDSDAASGYHDHQLMQECCALLESSNPDGPDSKCHDLLNLLPKFHTASWFERTLLHIIHQLNQFPHTLVDFLKDCVTLLDPASPLEKPNEVSKIEAKRIYGICRRLQSLTDFYVKFRDLNRNCSGEVPPVSEESWTGQLEDICDLLSWDPEDARCCLTVYDCCASVSKSHLALQLTRPFDLQSFLNCFTTCASPSVSGSPVQLAQFRVDGSILHLTKIGSLIFGPYLLGFQTYASLVADLRDGPLPADLLLLVLTSYILYWETCNHVPDLIYRIHGLCAHLLSVFCSHTSTDSPVIISSARNYQSALGLLLSQILALCLDTVHTSSAYLVSLIMRSLVYLMWNSVEERKDLVTALRNCSKFENSSSDDTISCIPPKEVSEESPVPGHNALETDPDQPRISMDDLRDLIDTWHDTCSRLEGLFFLGVLLQLPAVDDLPVSDPGSFSPNGFPVSLGRLLKLGRASLTELFSSWLVHWRVEPHMVIHFYQNVHGDPATTTGSSHPVAPSREVGDDVQRASCTELSIHSWNNLRNALFPLVYRRLPFTLEMDTVIASVCWLYYSRWLNEPDELYHLKMSIEFMRALSAAGAQIAQGLGSMMWNGRLRFWYGNCVDRVLNPNRQSSAKVMRTEKLKYLSMLLINFMATYIQAHDKAEVIPVFSVEREWSSCVLGDLHSSDLADETSEWKVNPPSQGSDASFSSSSAACSLVAETASNQPALDRRSLASWEQAVIVVSALLVFGCPPKPFRSSHQSSANVKPYTPADFFSAKDSSVIMTSFAPDWISSTLDDFSDTSLGNRRKFFLSWLIEQAVFAYQLTVTAAIDPSADRHPRPASSTQWRVHGPLDVYRLFSSAYQTLGRHWGFSKDLLNSHHALSLFEAGLDEQAELFLSQIQDKTGLASRLLIMIGRRVANCCFGATTDSTSQLRWRACVPFQLQSWLHGLSSEQQSVKSMPTPSSCDQSNQLIHLIDFVLQYLPTQASQFTMAELLRDTIYAVADDKNDD